MSLPTPFIIYTNKLEDKSGWVRYLPDSLNDENSDLVRMTIEELTLRSKRGNRQLCVISPKLALAVMQPEEVMKPKAGVKLVDTTALMLVDYYNKTHESIALAPSTYFSMQIIVQSKKRRQDNYASISGMDSIVPYMYRLSQSELTGDKKVKAILDIGPTYDSAGECIGRCYEIVLDWDGNTGAEIVEHVRALKRLCHA